MDDEKILALLFAEPEKIFTLYELGGGDYQDLKKMQIGKVFARERFPEIAEKDQIDSAEFMFWLSYFMERELNEDIVALEIQLNSSSKEKTEAMVDKMYFSEKIKYLVDNKHLKEDDPYHIFLKKFNKLRNHMAHGRLHELVYEGYSLSHPKGQIKVTADLRNALRRENL